MKTNLCCSYYVFQLHATIMYYWLPGDKRIKVTRFSHNIFTSCLLPRYYVITMTTRYQLCLRAIFWWIKQEICVCCQMNWMMNNVWWFNHRLLFNTLTQPMVLQSMKLVTFWNVWNFNVYFRELMNQYQSCLYLFECILYTDSKYDHKIP